MKKKGDNKRKWEVYVCYDYADKRRGDVISRHATYEAANRKARQSTFWAIRNTED